jgi:hypothetical protein
MYQGQIDFLENLEGKIKNCNERAKIFYFSVAPITEDGIFISPVEADPLELPKISISDYLLSKVRENGLEQSDKPWVVSNFYG